MDQVDELKGATGLAWTSASEWIAETLAGAESIGHHVAVWVGPAAPFSGSVIEWDEDSLVLDIGQLGPGYPESSTAHIRMDAIDAVVVFDPVTTDPENDEET